MMRWLSGPAIGRPWLHQTPPRLPLPKRVSATSAPSVARRPSLMKKAAGSVILAATVSAETRESSPTTTLKPRIYMEHYNRR